MIKLKKGEFTAKGDVETIIADMATIVHEVFCILDEHDTPKDAIEKTRELVNDAIALALGEKTDEEVFGKDDEDEDDEIDDFIDSLLDAALKKARK